MTNYWWVNQGETFEEERELGLIWAPLLSAANTRPSHWESMDRVEVGDLIFHYSKKCLRGVSRAILSSRPAARPYHRDEWNEMGREIRVDFQELDIPVPLGQIPPAHRANERQKNSPFSSVGRVNVGYLWDLSERFANELLKLAGLTVPSGTDRKAVAQDPDGMPRKFAFLMDETDGRILVSYRKEQPRLRSFLFGNSDTSACDLCHREFPLQFLVTAHIKPRAKCTEAEKRDENVVFGACVFGCDALFEGGHIYVDGTGTIVVAEPTSAYPSLRAATDSLAGNRVGRFGDLNSKYFDWHRRHRVSLRNDLAASNGHLSE